MKKLLVIFLVVFCLTCCLNTAYAEQVLPRITIDFKLEATNYQINYEDAPQEKHFLHDQICSYFKSLCNEHFWYMTWQIDSDSLLDSSNSSNNYALTLNLKGQDRGQAGEKIVFTLTSSIDSLIDTMVVSKPMVVFKAGAPQYSHPSQIQTLILKCQEALTIWFDSLNIVTSIEENFLKRIPFAHSVPISDTLNKKLVIRLPWQPFKIQEESMFRISFSLVDSVYSTMTGKIVVEGYESDNHDIEGLIVSFKCHPLLEFSQPIRWNDSLPDILNQVDDTNTAIYMDYFVKMRLEPANDQGTQRNF